MENKTKEVKNQSQLEEEIAQHNAKVEQKIASGKLEILPFQYPETHELKTVTKVLDTHVNLKWLLSLFDADIKWNLMTRRREISIPSLRISQEDIENSALFAVKYLATLHRMPLAQIDNHLDTIAQENAYHPIIQSISETPWDKTPRLDDFISTIKTTNDELSAQIIKTWMVCAIAAAYSVDGFINNGVLVILGEQNIGKTSWVRSLDPINCGAVKDGAFLDPNNKDSVAQLASFWITELGELDSIFQKSAIGRLKSFITMKFDHVRLPYARKAVQIPRRTAYIATVNDSSYLVDDTGNRRWWTIEALSINLDHGLNMQQVWAEAFNLWQSGHDTYLSKTLQNEVNLSNKDYEKIHPLKELLLARYNWKDPTRISMTATKILEQLGYHQPRQADLIKISIFLTELNGKKGRKSHGLILHEIPRFII
jgi:putative DNA primase/helicase